MKKGLHLILISILAWNCTNHDSPQPNLTPALTGIADKAYSKTYLYPPGFNYQQGLDGSLYYENTVSIRTSQTLWIELSTLDKQQAKRWSDTSSSTSAYYRDVVAERETDKYFEFKRVHALNKNDVILSRVHKSSYFIPLYDKFHPGDTIGILKATPINTATTKEFIEYLWTSYLISYTDKVLEYTITDYADKVGYNLKSVSITYGDFGLCDNITVRNFDFYIDKQSGTVTFNANKIQDIKGICR